MGILVFDDFNGANDTDIADHSPDIDIVGGGWKQSDINSVELDGSGAVKLAGAADAAWIDVGTTDQIAVSTINAGGADNRFQLVVRSDNQQGSIGTNYSLNIRQGVSGSDNLFLFKRVDGALTQLASAQVAFSSSISNEFELSAIGNNITAKVDGVEIFNITDSSIAAGSYAGIYHALYTNDALRVLDFTVEDTTAAPTVTADVSYTVSAPTIASTASASLPQPVADASFTVNAPTISGNASVTIPGFSASVSFTVSAPTVSSSVSATLPNPSADVSYTVSAPTFSVNAGASLPQPISDLAFTVNTPTVAANATATETGFNASVNFTVNAPTFAVDASATLPQPDSSVSFAVSTPSVSVVAIVGGIAIIVDDETNINQRVLSTNINAPTLSNNING